MGARSTDRRRGLRRLPRPDTDNLRIVSPALRIIAPPLRSWLEPPLSSVLSTVAAAKVEALAKEYHPSPSGIIVEWFHDSFHKQPISQKKGQSFRKHTHSINIRHRGIWICKAHNANTFIQFHLKRNINELSARGRTFQHFPFAVINLHDELPLLWRQAAEHELH